MTFEANLDPELAAALPAMETMGLRNLMLETIPLVREKFAATMRAIASKLPAPLDDVIVEDRHVPGAPGAPDVHLRIYRPKSDSTKTRAALYWMHGGGLVLGIVLIFFIRIFIEDHTAPGAKTERRASPMVGHVDAASAGIGGGKRQCPRRLGDERAVFGA